MKRECAFDVVYNFVQLVIVGQAILPAAGFLAGSAADVQAPPAGQKAGCSQDWLPHKAADLHYIFQV